MYGMSADYIAYYMYKSLGTSFGHTEYEDRYGKSAGYIAYYMYMWLGMSVDRSESCKYGM